MGTPNHGRPTELMKENRSRRFNANVLPGHTGRRIVPRGSHSTFWPKPPVDELGSIHSERVNSKCKASTDSMPQTLIAAADGTTPKEMSFNENDHVKYASDTDQLEEANPITVEIDRLDPTGVLLLKPSVSRTDVSRAEPQVTAPLDYDMTEIDHLDSGGVLFLQPSLQRTNQPISLSALGISKSWEDRETWGPSRTTSREETLFSRQRTSGTDADIDDDDEMEEEEEEDGDIGANANTNLDDDAGDRYIGNTGQAHGKGGGVRFSEGAGSLNEARLSVPDLWRRPHQVSHSVLHPLHTHL